MDGNAAHLPRDGGKKSGWARSKEKWLALGLSSSVVAKAGVRVMEPAPWFLEGEMKLEVIREKSAFAPVWERKFLGHRLLSESWLGVIPKSVERFKARIAEFTARRREFRLSG